MQSAEQVLLFAGIVCEVALMSILWRRGFLRRLPFFSGYVAWTVVSDVAAAVVARAGGATYFAFYRAEFLTDCLLQFLVLVELARSALRMLAPVLARSAGIFLILTTAGTGTLVWHLAGRWSQSAAWNSDWFLLLRVQLAASLLRIVFLLVLGGMIELLGRNLIPVGWGDRELQVATGLGVYALASLAASLRLCYPVSAFVFEMLHWIEGLTYFGVVVYWIVSFLRREASWIPEPRMETDSEEAGSGPGGAASERSAEAGDLEAARECVMR